MKYIKKYESNPNMTQYVGNKYWLIPTDYRLKTALLKIGCDDFFVESYLNNPNIKNWDYIFINNYTWFGEQQWSWNKYTGIERDLAFEENGSTYGGRVEITDSEIAAIKYNL